MVRPINLMKTLHASNKFSTDLCPDLLSEIDPDSPENIVPEKNKSHIMAVWWLSLTCGLCCDQIWNNASPQSNICNIIRNISSKVEIFSMMFSFPVPFVILLSLLVSDRCLTTSFHLSQTWKIKLTLCLVYLFTVLPSLLVDLFTNILNVAMVIGIKFSLASLHIILDPLILIAFRPDLQSYITSTFVSRSNKKI